jgi:uncharacterized membrane protein
MENEDNTNMFGGKLKPDAQKRSFKNIFLTGFVALTPLVVTFYILRAVYNLIVKNLDPVLRRIAAAYHIEIPDPFTGVVTVLLFVVLVFLVGILTRMYIGRLIISIIDRAATSIPGVSFIYNAIKQIIESFRSSTDNFQRVVIVQFPKNEVYCVAFVVKKTPAVLADVIGEPCLNIYIPTAPNPTSGFITVMPERNCRDVKISVEQGVKFIFSVGVINFDNPEQLKTVLEKQNEK